MIQPKDLVQFATDATFSAGPETGEITRLKPGGALLASGFIANRRRAAKHDNWLTGNVLDHITALADVYALNWQSFVPSAADPILIASGSEALRFVSAQDAATGIPWLVVRTVNTNTPSRSRDFFQTCETCNPLSDGGPGVPIIKLCADIDRRDRNAQNGLLAMSAVSKIYPSTNVGQTWGAGVVLGSVCTAIARSHPLGLVIVAGVNVIKTMNPALGALTSRTVPGAWSALTPAGIATARAGEYAGAGAIIWPEEASTAVLHSHDGVTWTNTNIGSGRVIGAAWSESHQEWFAVTSDGYVYRSAGPDNVGWTFAIRLAPGTSGRFTGITSFGRNLVITGVSIGDGFATGVAGGDGSAETGSILVTSDFVTFHPITTGIGEPGSAYSGAPTNCLESTVVHHDGRLVAGHSLLYATIDTNYHPHLAASMRAPWL